MADRFFSTWATLIRLTLLVSVWIWQLPETVFGGSSNSLMDITPNGLYLIVANTDSDSISLVDVKKNQTIKEIHVGKRPEGISWVGNGPEALVTLYNEDAIALVNTEKGSLKKLTGLIEPYGIICLRDGKTAYVSLDYPGKIAEIDLENWRVKRNLSAGEWCRGLALNADESRLYVTNFYSGTLTALDRVSGRVVDTWPGRIDENLSRHVLIHPKREKAYLSLLRSRTEVFDVAGSLLPYLTICDLWDSKKKPGETRRRSIKLDSYQGTYVVAEPWETAMTSDGKWFFGIHAATGDMFVSQVVDDDYRELDRQGRAIYLGKIPRAVRVSPDNQTLYVYTALDFAVQVYRISDMEHQKTISVCKAPEDAKWVRGNFLFHSANRPMTSRRWIACSSCHPGGLPDHRIWHNPEGYRKTPSLAGLAHTHPLHWSADRDEVQDFEYTIRGKLMGGRGLAPQITLKPRTEFRSPSELDQHLSGKSEDLDALAIYTNSFTPRLSPHIPAPGRLSEKAQLGKSIFFREDVGCVKCHSGPYYSDSSLKKPFHLHDVGTGNDPDEKMEPKYDTPTLLGVYRSAPYLHNGKAKTLMDVLTTCNPKDEHGKTSHLSQKEKEMLVEFLRSLPYENPPDETPNTVPFRRKTAKTALRR